MGDRESEMQRVREIKTTTIQIHSIAPMVLQFAYSLDCNKYWYGNALRFIALISRNQVVGGASVAWFKLLSIILNRHAKVWIWIPVASFRFKFDESIIQTHMMMKLI